MDPKLAEPLAELMRDVNCTGAPEPAVRDEAWAESPGQLSAWLAATDGSAAGVSVLEVESAAARLVHLADQVQDWVHEELGRQQLPATWPECRIHPGTHPLEPALADAGPVWCCPRTREAVARIGRLGD